MAASKYLNSALRALTSQLRLKGGVTVETLAATYTFGPESPNVGYFNADSSNRNMQLEAEEACEGFFGVYYNSGSAGNLVFLDDAAATVATVGPGEMLVLACDGTSWGAAVTMTEAGAHVWTGTTAFGVDGTGVDVTFYGDTASRWLIWDYSEDTLRAQDNSRIGWGSGAGTTPDIHVSWDGTRLNVGALTANSEIRWGADDAGIDQRWYGDTASRALVWDQSADALRADDNTTIGWGSGAGAAPDIGIAWDATKLVVSQLTANSAVEWGVDGAGLDQVWYGDTPSAKAMWDQSADAFVISGAAVEQFTGSTTGTGRVIQHYGATLSEGMDVVVYEATVSPAAIETALLTLPANSVVDSVQANVQSALTGGGTTVTFSIGITGDVDLFGTAFSGGVPADLLTQNAKINAIGTRAGAGAGIGAYNASTVAVKLIGAATGGATAGDTALTVGSVRVVIRYRVLASLANA